MKVLIYDGTFDGLLTACFLGYQDKEVTNIVPFERYQLDLLQEPQEVITDKTKADRVYHSILTNLSAYTLENIYYAYLSELPGCDFLILQYLRLCYQKGPKINAARQHPIIDRIYRLRFKVTRELERMKGFLRFQELAPLFFLAQIESDHNLLPILIPHLQKRFSDQDMLIFDQKRNRALLIRGQQSTIIPFTQDEVNYLLAQSCDDEYIQLFRQYFQTINIPERENLRQQSNYMPRRYRKNMMETAPLIPPVR